MNRREITITSIVIILELIIGIFLIGQAHPLSYEYPNDQYTNLAPSFAKGHLYLENPVDERLIALENPYDYGAREEAMDGEQGYFDAAYYNGHYYLYFGVIPELTCFLPYYLITGNHLPNFYAVQFYYAFALLGIFIVFIRIRTRLYPSLPFICFIFLSVAFSAMSLWHAVSAPTMYCLSILSGVAFQIFCLILLYSAMYQDDSGTIRIASQKNTDVNVIVGAFCGALVFGCRPTIGMVSIMVLPFIFVCFREKNYKYIAYVCLAYAIVASGLMAYNYFRFQSPFEFGHKYQITESDFLHDGASLGIRGVFTMLYRESIKPSGYYTYPPFVRYEGVLLEFPILFLTGLIFVKNTFNSLKEKKLFGVILFCFLSVLATLVMIGLNVTYLFERYKMDFTFVLCIVCFIIIAAAFDTIPKKNRQILAAVVCILCVLAVVRVILMFMIPDDLNYAFFYPEIIEKVFGTPRK